jgi:hypothetical protein
VFAPAGAAAAGVYPSSGIEIVQELEKRANLAFMSTQEFACEKCGQSFASEGDLTRHYDQVHPEMGKEAMV